MSSKGNSKSGEAMTSRLPPDTDQKTFKHFLWNPKTQTVLGRSGASWGKSKHTILKPCRSCVMDHMDSLV